MLADLQRKRVAQDHLEVLLLDAMAADPEPYPGDKIACEKEYVREEVAAIQRVAPITAGKRLHVAAQLTARFPNTIEAMQDGLLPGYFATRLVELPEALSDAHAAKVEKRVLPRVGQQTSASSPPPSAAPSSPSTRPPRKRNTNAPARTSAW